LVEKGECPAAVGIDPVLNLITPSDVLMPASFLVQRWVNRHLEGNASPQLRYDVRSGKRVIQIVPENLLAAMWLQFAQAIAGNRTYRACKECGRWFEISVEGDGFRINRLFCSDACKSRDYRRGKREEADNKARGKKASRTTKRKG
jgi:hypothetical protein